MGRMLLQAFPYCGSEALWRLWGLLRRQVRVAATGCCRGGWLVDAAINAQPVSTILQESEVS